MQTRNFNLTFPLCDALVRHQRSRPWRDRHAVQRYQRGACAAGFAARSGGAGAVRAGGRVAGASAACARPQPRQDGAMDTNFPLIVGISGASGAVYGVRLLEVLKAHDIPAHAIVSKTAGADAEGRSRPLGRPGAGAGANELPECGSRCRHFLGLVPHARHDHRALLDPHVIRHRLRHHGHAS